MVRPAARQARGASARWPRLEPPVGLEGFEVDDSLLLLTWPSRPASPEPGLTPSETEVLELVRAGHSNLEIAARRGRSRRTVDHQVASIFEKLGVRSRQELFARVSRNR